VVPAGLAYTVTYNGSTTQPVNAGTYAVVATVNDVNYTGTKSATLVIQKATAQVTLTASTLTQTYTATARTVTASTTPAGLAYTVTYNGSSTPPVNAGSYAVVATVNDVNYTGTKSGTLVVQKAPATVTVGTYVIDKGQALPTFTATYSGFLNGQTASVVTSISFALSPSCTGNAGVYQIIPTATALNYTFTAVNGTLYINPAGSSAKQVKPNFICYQQLATPNAQGYTHIAYFNYENPNSTPVYIPVGTKNSFSGSARDASQQPVVFMPGTSAPIAIPYMGGSLTWQVTSNKSSGTAGSIPANTSNVVCTTPGVRTLFYGQEEEVPAEVRVYPNPSSGIVHLQFPDALPEGTSVEVYNAQGGRCLVPVRRTSDQLMEMDLGTFGQGMYLIHVVQEGDRRTYRVVIE